MFIASHDVVLVLTLILFCLIILYPGALINSSVSSLLPPIFTSHFYQKSALLPLVHLSYSAFFIRFAFLFIFSNSSCFFTIGLFINLHGPALFPVLSVFSSFSFLPFFPVYSYLTLPYLTLPYLTLSLLFFFTSFLSISAFLIFLFFFIVLFSSFFFLKLHL